jgi:hypothetical protein
MAADTNDKAGMDRLRQVLDAYGGDAARWPRADAERLATLVASDAVACRAVAEARALDRVLAMAPGVDAAHTRSLADRIAAEVMTNRVQVVDLATRRAAGTIRPLPRRNLWRAGAALAASLLVGMFVGASDLPGSMLDGVASLVGVSNDTDTLTAALGQALQAPFDEETL